MKPCPFCRSSNIKFGGDDKRIVEWCLAGATLGPNQYGCYEWNSRAERIEELEAKLEKAVEALKECVEEIDAYIQFQYPYDHPVQERSRQQDYATNPARVALAEIKGETE